MNRYLVALSVDALGTTVLATVALPSGSPWLVAVALLSAVGLLLAVLAMLAVLATAAYEEGGRRGLPTGLLLAGLTVNTVGCVAVLLAAGADAHPLTLPAALLLLVIGDVLSLVYLRVTSIDPVPAAHPLDRTASSR